MVVRYSELSMMIEYFLIAKTTIFTGFRSNNCTDMSETVFPLKMPLSDGCKFLKKTGLLYISNFSYNFQFLSKESIPPFKPLNIRCADLIYKTFQKSVYVFSNSSLIKIYNTFLSPETGHFISLEKNKVCTVLKKIKLLFTCFIRVLA